MDKRTKESLLQYMALRPWCLSAVQVGKKLKESGCKIPFDVTDWDCYIKKLTGRLPCLYCGAPTDLIVTGNKFVDDISVYKCFDRPKGHTLMLRTEKSIINRGRTAKAAREYMLEECRHGELKFDCANCICEQVQKNMETT